MQHRRAPLNIAKELRVKKGTKPQYLGFSNNAIV